MNRKAIINKRVKEAHDKEKLTSNSEEDGHEYGRSQPKHPARGLTHPLSSTNNNYSAPRSINAQSSLVDLICFDDTHSIPTRMKYFSTLSPLISPRYVADLAKAWRSSWDFVELGVWCVSFDIHWRMKTLYLKGTRKWEENSRSVVIFFVLDVCLVHVDCGCFSIVMIMKELLSIYLGKPGLFPSLVSVPAISWLLILRTNHHHAPFHSFSRSSATSHSLGMWESRVPLLRLDFYSQHGISDKLLCNLHG